MSSPSVLGFFDPDTSTVTYLVFDERSRDALIIDPVLDYDALRSQTATDSADRVIAQVKEKDLVVRAVLDTHAHADHISAGRYLATHFGVPVGIGSEIHLVQKAFAKIFNLPDDVPVDGSQFDLLLESGRVYPFGSLEVKPLSTPGHTPACLSYVIGDAVFTGDALFTEDYGTGRTDFPAGSAAALYHSVTETLYGLPESTRVFVGHDYQPGGREVRFETTIAEERRHNVQLPADRTEAAFIQFRNERDGALDPPRLIYQSIQINVFGGKLPQREANGTRYLRVPLNVRRPTDENGKPLADAGESGKPRALGAHAAK